MRLNRLDLTRYGHFTDRVLDFGEAVPGQPDLHIVHGPNEAGKSTLLSAWLDLLFGIPARSDHAFLHDYKSMQIGAELALADGRHALVRTKGNKDTLTEGGAPVSEAVLAAALGGLDRAACAEMFALDAATMEQGGDLILSSQGRLGELLFAATAGLSELSRRLDALDARGAEFWKKGSTKGLSRLTRRSRRSFARAVFVMSAGRPSEMTMSRTWTWLTRSPVASSRPDWAAWLAFFFEATRMLTVRLST